MKYSVECSDWTKTCFDIIPMSTEIIELEGFIGNLISYKALYYPNKLKKKFLLSKQDYFLFNINQKIKFDKKYKAIIIENIALYEKLLNQNLTIEENKFCNEGLLRYKNLLMDIST